MYLNFKFPRTLFDRNIFILEALKCTYFKTEAFTFTSYLNLRDSLNSKASPTNIHLGSWMRRSFDKKNCDFCQFQLFSKKNIPLTSEAVGSSLLGSEPEETSSVSMETSVFIRPCRLTHVTTKCCSGFESFPPKLCKLVIIWRIFVKLKIIKL